MTDVSRSWLAARWVAIVFLLWNLVGIAAFVMQWTADLDELAKTDPYQARTFAEMPAWTWAAYAIAVIAGTLSAVLLVLRRTGAVALSALEVVAVIVQFSYTFGMTDLLSVKGPADTVPLPAAIILIAILQLFYARWMAGKGLLG